MGEVRMSSVDLRDKAKTLEVLARKLVSGARPGHVEYVNKETAAFICEGIAKELMAASNRQVPDGPVKAAPKLLAACLAMYKQIDPMCERVCEQAKDALLDAGVSPPDLFEEVEP